MLCLLLSVSKATVSAPCERCMSCCSTDCASSLLYLYLVQLINWLIDNFALSCRISGILTVLYAQGQFFRSPTVGIWGLSLKNPHTRKRSAVDERIFLQAVYNIDWTTCTPYRLPVNFTDFMVATNTPPAKKNSSNVCTSQGLPSLRYIGTHPWIGVGAQSTLRARHICRKIYVHYEKSTKCLNFTWYLPEKKYWKLSSCFTSPTPVYRCTMYHDT